MTTKNAGWMVTLHYPVDNPKKYLFPTEELARRAAEEFRQRSDITATVQYWERGPLFISTLDELKEFMGWKVLYTDRKGSIGASTH